MKHLSFTKISTLCALSLLLGLNVLQAQPIIKQTSTGAPLPPDCDMSGVFENVYTVHTSTTNSSLISNKPAIGIGTTTPSTLLHLQTSSQNPDLDAGHERFFRCSIAPEDDKDFFEISNLTNVDRTFLPCLWGHKTCTSAQNFSLYMIGSTLEAADNNDDIPIMGFDARAYVSSASLTPSDDEVHEMDEVRTIINRPLFDWRNAGASQMRMLANGYLGIGTISPTEQLHTTLGVRFEGLPSATTQPYVILQDANGVLYKGNYSGGGSGLVNNCLNNNFIPKVSGGGASLTCSQIQDNGTGVGIGMVPGVYTGGGAMTAGSPASPTSVKLDVNGLTRTTTLVVTSDARFKKDITALENPLAKVMDLKGVTYNWRNDEFPEKDFGNVKQIGFIAQELEKVIPEAVVTDENGYYSVNYFAVIPVLTEAIKEQQKMLNKQAEEIEQLKKQQNSKGSFNPVQDIKLYQNEPNPFNSSTIIRYYLPAQVGQAALHIFDLQGKLIKTLPLSEKGNASVTIKSNELQPGMYIYSLIADGKEIDTKKMILTAPQY